MSPLYLNPWLYIPAAAVALLGLWLLYFALLRDRSHARRPRPRCPKCWYDLSGAPSGLPMTCPECGRGITHERDLHRTRRKPWLALVALPLLAMLPALSYLRGDLRRAWYALPPKWVTVETIRVGDTVAKLKRLRDPDGWGMRAVVTSRGGSLLDIEDYDIEFGQAKWRSDGSRDTKRLGAADDLNGDGIKDLVIFAYSGGAHCCYTVYVIELSDPPCIIATIDARNGMGIETETNDNHQGESLFDICDQSFDYWNAPHADSAFASVYYRLRSHRLEFALDRMLKKSEVVLDQTRREERGPLVHPIGALPLKREPRLDPELWRIMLTLLYSGNEQECWRYFDENWPDDFSGPPTKEQFKAEFLDILNKSPQYRDFKAALAAQAEGKPIPPALVGQHQPQR